MNGSLWFKRLVRDCKKISRHIRIKRIGHGFYRVYWRQAYIYELYKEMPQVGYECIDKDFNFIEKKYVQDREDQADMTRKVKNFVEGYWDSLATIRTRVYMMRHNKEYNEMATRRYSTVTVK